MTDLVKREELLSILRAMIIDRPSDPLANQFDGALHTVIEIVAALPSEPAPEVGTDTMANPRGGYSTERPGL